MSSQRQVSVTVLAVMLSLPLGTAFPFGPTPLPDDMVPVPSIGDRGLYRVTLSGEWAGDEPVREWAFEWGEESASGASALLPDAIRLHTWGEDWPPTMDTIEDGGRTGPTELFMTSDGAIVAAQIPSFHEQRNDAHAAGWNPTAFERSVERMEFFTETIQSCIVFGFHQGRPIDAATVSATAPCRLPFVPEALPPEMTLQPSHVTTLPGGYPAVEATGSDDDWTIRSWTAPNIAYPLRLDVGRGEASASFELIGIEAGDGRPITKHSAVESQMLAPIPTHPLTPLGPAAGGWSFNWELPELIEAARGDPTWTDLDEYLQAHPDAVVIHASESSSGLREMRKIGLSDGEVMFWFWAHRSVDAPGIVTYSREAFLEQKPGSQQWPTHAPTYGAVGARFEDTLKDMEWPTGPVRLRFDMHCAASCAAGEAVISARTSDSASAWLGVDDDLGLVLWESNGEGVSMTIDQDGHIRRIVTATQHSESEVDGFGHLEALTSDGGSAPPPSDALARHQDLGAPTPWPWVGAGAFVLLLATLLSLSKFKAAVWVGFTRLRNEQILRHPMRSEILRIIEAEPGIHLSEIHRRIDLHKSSLIHHMRKLEHAGAVVIKNENGRTCYFMAGRIDNRMMAAIPLLKSNAARRVLEIVQARPGISLSGLAQDAGIAVSTANYHVHRLSSCGLVGTEKIGKMLVLRPLSLAKDASEKLRTSNDCSEFDNDE